MAEYKMYHGNCHCGAFRFQVQAAPLDIVYECNCSNCSKNGVIWLVGVAKEDLQVKEGEGILKEYMTITAQSNGTILFCPTCGTSVMERKRDQMHVINVRTFSNVDLETLTIIPYDMSKVLPLYDPLHVPDDYKDMELEDRVRLYHGSCQCGAVTYAMKSKPLSDVKVISCNCSLCSRNGDLWIYPSKSCVHVNGKENLEGYEFLHNDSLHSFCRTCGVSVLVDVTEPGTDIMPINVRTLNEIDLAGLKLKRYDGRSNDPQYGIS